MFGDFISFVAAQLIGAFLGAVIVWLVYFRHWGETKDQGAKLGVFSTGPAIRNPVWNNVTEIIGTIVLVFGVYAIFTGERQQTASAPTWSASWSGASASRSGGPTGYAINPARDLGPRIAHQILPIAGKGGSDWGLWLDSGRRPAGRWRRGRPAEDRPRFLATVRSSPVTVRCQLTQTEKRSHHEEID